MVTLSLDLVNNIDADRFDIEESFESLDVHKTGRLGYDRELAKQIENDLQDNRDDEGVELGIKLETLLKIVATLEKNRSVNFVEIGFELIDHDRKGYIDASDIQRLCSDVGKIDNDVQEEVTISTDEAKAMIETTNDIFAQNNDNHRLNPLVFQKILAPPSP